MNICFVGSLVPTDVFDTIVLNSRQKPSNAPVNFERMLVKGLAENNEKVTCISFPNMATYPNSGCIFWKKTRYQMDEGIEIIAPSFINVIGIKQLLIYIKTFWNVHRFLKERKETSYVISYSNYPPYSRAVRHACRSTQNGRAVLLMADLPTYMYANQKKRDIRQFLVTQMEHMNERDYGKFDAYVLLTQYMSEAMGIEHKPSVVVEGFADLEQFDFQETKNVKPTVMYAGGLSQTYNIRLLVDAFMKTCGDYELWIFGSGTDEKYVIQAAEQDKRIQFFGKVSREELLHRMKQAHLLVSVKSADEGHTRYAFPSKILEYMTSGTPVITTRIPGIPVEYFDYLIPIENESATSLAQQFSTLLTASEKTLQTIGDKGYCFVKMNKTMHLQAKKIIDLLSTVR